MVSGRSLKLVIAAWLTLQGEAALAQSPADNPASGPVLPQPAAPQQAAPAPGSASAVNRANTELVVTLVRTTMVAVQQANFSGNYSVLRDIAAPDFQVKNTAADLARVFTNIRELKIDLGAAVLLDPQISRAELTPDKKLYIVGAFSTKPVPVTFEMLFQPAPGVWRIYGISITPVQNLTTTPAPMAFAPTVNAAPIRNPKPKPKKTAPKIAPPDVNVLPDKP